MHTYENEIQIPLGHYKLNYMYALSTKQIYSDCIVNQPLLHLVQKISAYIAKSWKTNNGKEATLYAKSVVLLMPIIVHISS